MAQPQILPDDRQAKAALVAFPEAAGADADNDVFIRFPARLVDEIGSLGCPGRVILEDERTFKPDFGWCDTDPVRVGGLISRSDVADAGCMPIDCRHPCFGKPQTCDRAVGGVSDDKTMKTKAGEQNR